MSARDPNTLPPPETDRIGVDRFDAIVIGAGVSGLCQLYALRDAGLSVQCFEEGGGVGGTWYWNRYPGCAFDTPSETYTYSFSDELSQEWEWTHHFAKREEAEAYLNHVADRFDLRPHIRLNSRVKSATWIEEDHLWEVELEDGLRARATFLLPAVGVLSAAIKPAFEGLDRYQGEQYITSRWPRTDPDFAGKRVAVIGTGSTAVQLIPEVAKLCGHLTVFQRTPNYGVPSENAPIAPEVQREWKENYQEIHRQAREGIGLRVTMDPRRGRDVPQEERLAMYEEGWRTRRGVEKFMVLFHDLLSDREILEEYSEFVRGKMRERIDDPAVAAKLVPTEHVFMAKRVPTETFYFEAFNRDNVELVDVRETPIECLTEKGIETSDREREFDIVIFATGFDGVTGAMTRIDIRGTNGQTIKEKWGEVGLSSYLGLTVKGFPNLFISCIPSISAAHPPGAESSAAWFKACIVAMRENGYTRIEPTQEAEDAWMEKHDELGKQMVIGGTDSWYVGSNVPGKKRKLLIYCKPAGDWRRECFAVLENGLKGFDLQSGDRSATLDTETVEAAR